MSAIPAEWKWSDHYKGSTFSPKKIKFNFDITGATIKCQLKWKQGGSIIAYEWITGTNITVVNALLGEVILDKINFFDIKTGDYIYDVQIIFADGTRETYIKGSQKIIQDITI